MNKQRMLNGYIAIYKPEHPSAYTTDNWLGWIYEHRYIIEQSLGRPLSEDEVVHHLDCDKTNNNPENLIVLANKASHIRLHHWIDAGGNVVDTYTKKLTTYYGRAKPLCKICFIEVTEHFGEYCSNTCRAKDNRRTDRPSQEQLITLIKSIGYLQVGKMYNVSDNSIRKWVKSFGLNPKDIKKEQ